MSLINQMLRDLENRSEGPVLEQQEVLQGLGSTRHTGHAAKGRRSALPYLLIGLLTVVCAILLLDRFGLFRQSGAEIVAESYSPARLAEQNKLETPDPVVQKFSAVVAPEPLPEWRDTGTDPVYEMLPQSRPVEQSMAEISQPPAVAGLPVAEALLQPDEAGLIEQLHEKINQGAYSIEQTPESGAELAGVLVGDSSDSMHWDALQAEQKSVPLVGRKIKHDPPPVVTIPVVEPQLVDKSEVTFSKTPVQKSDREQALEYYQEAVKQIKRRKHNQAIASLQQAIQLDQKFGEARILLATQLLGQGQNSEAEQLLANGLQAMPKDSALAYTYARILVAQDRVAEALSILERAQPRVEINPDYHAFSAALSQRQEEHQAAISKYSEVLRIRPDKGVWWMGLGISLQAEGLQQRALQAFQTALRDNSLTVSIRQYLSDRITILQGATG